MILGALLFNHMVAQVIVNPLISYPYPIIATPGASLSLATGCFCVVLLTVWIVNYGTIL